MEIRRPAVAGMFYPRDPVELSKTIAGFFATAKKKPLPGRPMAVIAPHAGYTYSGQIAVQAYKQLEGLEVDTVVVISPSHTVFFKGSSVFDGDAYQTPLGNIEIDQELAGRIGSIHPLVFSSNKGHTGGSVRGEHALEVQLPLLQQVLGNFKLVAIVMGDQEIATCRALGEVLASALADSDCLIVASTDLSHFHPDKEARKLDGNVRKPIENYDPETLLGIISSGRGEACGAGPVAATLMATKRLGGEDVTVTGYSTSGETTGDFSEVVGYLSAVITTGKTPRKRNRTQGTTAAKKDTGLSDEDKKYLKNLARESIRTHLAGTKPSPGEPPSKIVTDKRGAFVTVKINGVLRGCIGQIRAAQPLHETVAEMARAAAFEDPRFVPLNEAEMDNIDVEISALSPLTRVDDLNDIKIGRDGLLIVLGTHSGLLLPQVATENNWDRTTFLEQTCLKAGLPKNSYKDKTVQIYRFSADIF